MECRKYLLLMAIIIALQVTLSGTVMEEYEYTLVDSLLQRAGQETNSLGFIKDWSLSTEYKINRIVDIINRPMEFPGFVDNLRDMMNKGDSEKMITGIAGTIFSYDDQILTGELDVVESKKYFSDYMTLNVQNEYDLFDYVEMLFLSAERYRSQAFETMTENDKELIARLSYKMWSDTGDDERYEKFYPELADSELDELPLIEIKEILDKIDWAMLVKAGKVFCHGTEVLNDNLNRFEFSNKSPLRQTTEWGDFVIGTRGDDNYYERFALIIEPGGNDNYYGELYNDFKHPYYLVIDMDGDDLWSNRKVGGLNRVLGGIGYSIDRTGDDSYFGDDLAFSAFAGIQYHYDGGGNDIYRLGRYTLGAATFGISININSEGNDIYHTTGYSQGFGGTLGAGILIDLAGNDLYYTGARYKHKPLRPDDYRSMAQGFGFGVRPDWGGGVGILYDKGGNDSFEGGIYAQGVGYWYALGILISGGGNDTFNAVQYAQGSGIHLAGGFLFNEAGDNSYYSRFGPGQGAGHDYAVGFLIDRSGDDHYSIDGGNGLGLTNSVGIFLDVAGDDRYERNRDINYGYANQARDSGGIGIFMDLGGVDIYPDTIWQNDSFWVRGLYGIGLDTEIIDYETEVEDEEEIVSEDISFIDDLTDVEELFSIAAEWEVGSSVDRVRRARARILEFEEAVTEHIIENKLDTKSGLEYRAIYEFALSSEYFQDNLADALTAEDSLKVKNAINLIGDLQIESYLDHLSSFLREKKYITTVIAALGMFSDDEAVTLIVPYIDSPSEHIRFVTARSLLNIDSDLSRRFLFDMRDDPSFLIRTTVKIVFPNLSD